VSDALYTSLFAIIIVALFLAFIAFCIWIER